MRFHQALFALYATALSYSTSVAAVEISSSSTIGQKLLQNARNLNENEVDYSFLAEYSIKFQGCHHVQQWNDNADDENDVKIMTKRLARFRLCPNDQCSNDRSQGCATKFGDYVVDMDTFVEAYLEALEYDKEDVCGNIDCSEYECNDDDADCLYTCYEAQDMLYCLDDDEGFDAKEYAACQQFDLKNDGRRHLEDNANNGNNANDDGDIEYYIGAFCADQGGEIHLGLFTDDTCTTFANNGYTLFQNTMGYTMPFSESSLVSTRCLSCGEDQNGAGYYESKGVCEDTYTVSGKCETRMSIDYPNESSCNYIEGIKIIRQDGVIRTSSTKKSKAAAVAIGLFTTLSVLLAAYVYYLRTKLSRAQINLAASSAPLT